MTVWLQHYVTCMSTAVPAIFAACPDAAAKATHGHGDVSPRTGSTRERSARHVYPLLGVVSGRCMGVVFCWRSEWSFEILSMSYNTHWRFATITTSYTFDSLNLKICRFSAANRPKKQAKRSPFLKKKIKSTHARFPNPSKVPINQPTHLTPASPPTTGRSSQYMI